jgi:hypothetical protein
MARPPLPIGSWGEFSTWVTQTEDEGNPTRYKSQARYRDHDGHVRPVSAYGKNKTASRQTVLEKLQHRAKTGHGGGENLPSHQRRRDRAPPQAPESRRRSGPCGSPRPGHLHARHRRPHRRIPRRPLVTDRPRRRHRRHHPQHRAHQGPRPDPQARQISGKQSPSRSPQLADRSPPHQSRRPVPTDILLRRADTRGQRHRGPGT